MPSVLRCGCGIPSLEGLLGPSYAHRRAEVHKISEPIVQVLHSGKTHDQKLNRWPDECPICLQGCEPKRWGHEHFIYGADTSQLEVVFQCPRFKCRRLFIALYGPIDDQLGGLTKKYYLRGYIPRSSKPAIFGKQITEASASFAEIYNQALVAEGNNLHHICGPGYRKALEFLIKAFLITVQNVPKKTIESKYLGPCIADHLSGTDVAKCATRAAWLGNDETHFVRKWTDKDLADLKILIELTVRCIETDMLKAQYKQEMPAK